MAVKTRKDYQTMIWTYKQRRAVMKKKYASEVYRIRVKKVKQKIDNWTRQIRRIDAISRRVEKLILDVNNYFNVDISLKTRKVDYELARKVYYKYGIDNGINGASLNKAIGRKTPNGPSCQRRKFTASFKDNKKNKEAYHKFKEYIEQSQ